MLKRKRKNKKNIIIMLILVSLVISSISIINHNIADASIVNMEKSVINEEKETILTENSISKIKNTISIVEELVNTIKCYNYNFNLLARVVMAEVGGNNCEYCKRMVIDTVLNRIESNQFANTIPEVILDQVAFETVKNKSIWKVTPTNDIYVLIIEELEKRTNTEVLAFQEGTFHSFGYAVTSCHNAYFSGMY